MGLLLAEGTPSTRTNGSLLPLSPSTCAAITDAEVSDADSFARRQVLSPPQAHGLSSSSFEPSKDLRSRSWGRDSAGWSPADRRRGGQAPGRLRREAVTRKATADGTGSERSPPTRRGGNEIGSVAPFSAGWTRSIKNYLLWFVSALPSRSLLEPNEPEVDFLSPPGSPPASDGGLEAS